MLRVLYLNPTVELGGAERSLVELVSGLGGGEVERLAACASDGPLPRALRAAGVRVFVNPVPAFTQRAGRQSVAAKVLTPLAAPALLPHVLRMAALVRRERVDVLHTNGLKSHLVGAAVRALTGRRLIWHVRDVLKPGPTRSFFGLVARAAVTRLVANSRAVAATFPGMPAARLRVIYNGLDTERYAPGPADPAVRRSLGASEGDVVVGMIGHLAPLKGHVHLIRAAPRILAACPAARFVIVGEEIYATLGHGGYRRGLEEEARRLGVRERFVFAGFREDPAAVLRCFDVLIHASVHPESFGRVLAEAMACGVPVVATALGGPTEIIASEDQGILVPPGDPAAIAEAVARVLADAALRERMRRAGRERVVAAFGVERYVREVRDLYRSLEA